MPLYCYECKSGHKFEQFSSMDNRHNAICPTCSEAGSIMIPRLNMRVAYPFRVIDSSGKEIAWKADGGISPPVGQPYPVGG